MQLRNTYLEYGTIAKFFHWLIFILVIGNIVLGFSISYLHKDSLVRATHIHQLNGLTIFVLVFLRLIWALINVKPILPPATQWEDPLRKLVHSLLYVVLLAIPLSGWVFSTAENNPPVVFNTKIPFPGIPLSNAIGDYGLTTHLTLVWILIILVVLHILAALKHHFYDRDDIFLRMIPFRSRDRITK